MRECGSVSEAMAALARGERQAFDVVYNTLRPLVTRYCAHVLGFEEAEDAAQEVLLRLFSQAERYRPGSPVEAWALSLAKWECRTRMRRRSRAREDTCSDPPPDHATETESDERVLAAAVAVVVDAMNPIDRAAIVAYLDDAEEPTAVFRKRKQRALARLRTAWRRLYGAG